MMGSSHTYDLAAAGAAGGRPGAAAAAGAGGSAAGGAQRADIEVALNPEELDLDPAEMAARYEQGVREQQSHLAKDRQVRDERCGSDEVFHLLEDALVLLVWTCPTWCRSMQTCLVIFIFFFMFFFLSSGLVRHGG